ncbi:uncharacterized protein [Haliotis cracherodii]|uniref:uncharacterized protein n=1 Tax=Haliotis cracherodii TaxID=6455 RepID=UPI0039E775F3
MTMHPKPKSAPPRIKSKFMSNKSNAMKEMEAWVKKDADPLGANHEASRMSGQLVDNVTEERMLKSKLWDLSKERYKFLTQNAYEKKVFVDRMQRKSSVFKRMLTQSDTMSSRRSSIENSDSSVSSYRVKGPGKCTNARQAFLERMDPKNGRDRPRELRNGDHGLKGKSVTFIPDLVTEMAAKSSGAFKLPVTHSAKPWANESLATDAPRLPNVVVSAAGLSAASVTMLGAIGRESAGGGVKTWAKKGSSRRYGMSMDSLTNDRRYSNLEHALTPIKDYQTSFDVKDIVKNMDCLHIPPRKPKESKPKIGMKALDFMKERGFAF